MTLQGQPRSIEEGDVGIECGGGRAGPGCEAFVHEIGRDAEFDLIGSAYGEAFPLGENSMRAVWYSVRLVGRIPGVGQVAWRYRDDKTSVVDITSNESRPGSFFPARALQHLHYAVDVLDNAGKVLRTLLSDEPVVMEAEIESIPPIGTTFRTLEDVTFMSGHVPVFTLRAGSPGEVNNPGGLELVMEDVATDSVRGTFSLLATIASPFDLDRRVQSVEWFATGLRSTRVEGRYFDRSSEARNLARIPISGSYDRAASNPAVVVHAFSPHGAAAEAHHVVPLA